jgi:hypothetical protein
MTVEEWQGTEDRQHTWRTRQEIEVCEDCIYVSANGAPDYEDYATSGHFQRYTKAVHEYGDEPTTTQDEPSFSWQSCDFCGGTLGGSRYTASVMQLHREETGK